MKTTVPLDSDQATMAATTLAVEVLEGPDAGKIAGSEQETLTLGTASCNQVQLTDSTVSRFHVELRATEDGVEVRDPGSTNGVFLGQTRLAQAVVPLNSQLRLGRTVVQIRSGVQTQVPLHEGAALGRLRGVSAPMRRLMEQVKRAAESGAATLIVGESGTGKELIAEGLHELSKRASGPFVTVDCGALAPNLVASELFGHERGAFTGAERQHIGAFERAHGGTIFLDEIGELPPSLQPALLGALERRSIRRVGGRTDIPVDVRVVAATHRDLRAEVNEGSFRLDLYYRLAVVTLQAPALRDRPEDIPLLVEHFVSECGHQDQLEQVLTSDYLNRLQNHRWPGNVRELRNVVEATLAMGDSVRVEEILASGPQERHGRDPRAFDMSTLFDLTYKEARGVLLHVFEDFYLRERLDRARGNVSRMSREAQMDRSHLTTLLQRHKIK